MSWDYLLLGATHDVRMNIFITSHKNHAHIVALIWKILNQPKIVNPISSKITTIIFLLSLPSAPFIFTL
jgi:hypothetical protein